VDADRFGGSLRKALIHAPWAACPGDYQQSYPQIFWKNPKAAADQ
jgi:hypothetical protein